MKQDLKVSILAPFAIAAAMTLGACARETNSDVYSGASVGDAIHTQHGVVENVRIVRIKEEDLLERNKIGQLVGGAAGGVAGTQIGEGWGRTIAIGVGAVLGATVGALAEQEAKKQDAAEYVVRTESGQLLTIVQGVEPRLSSGQRVYIQTRSRSRARVIPIN